MPDFSPVSVRVPATSANLGPGFDSLGLSLALYNDLSLRVCDQDFLSVEGEGATQLSGQTHTLGHLAAHRVFAAMEIEARGVELSLFNRIPFSRGLGSSSAAIVGGLVAANEWARKYHRRTLGSSQLLDLASEIEGHPDNVAPALWGGLVVAATSENGAISALKVPVAAFPHFAVWIPETELATKTARGVLPETYSRTDAIWNLSRAALLVAALSSGDHRVLSEALRDKIHQDYRAPLVPGFISISRAALGVGAFGVTLSGAGPSILVWMPENRAPIVEAMNRAARDEKIAGRVEELGVDLEGCRVVG